MAGWRNRNRRAVSASELAQMGACERQVYFEHKYGKRTTAEQRSAIARGNREHARFFKEAARAGPQLQSSQGKPWCFIASAVFGPTAIETRTLRLFRDQVLRPTRLGRIAIRFYYRVTPTICPWLLKTKWATRIVRCMLLRLVKLARLVLVARARKRSH